MIAALAFFGLFLSGTVVAHAGGNGTSTALLTSQRVNLTHYCPCPICCGKWSGCPTASGKWPKEGRTMAAPKWIPFGTRIFIIGVGWRVVEDRTKSGKGWDVFVRSHREAVRRGTSRKIVEVFK